MTRRSQLLMMVAAALGLLAPRGAGAHSDLERSDPKFNAALAAGPERVVLFFDEAVDLAASTFDFTGNPRPAGKPEGSYGSPDHRTVHVALPRAGEGRYILTWYMLSAVDGHVIGGELPFSVQAEPAPAAASPAPAPATPATPPTTEPAPAPAEPAAGGGAFAPSRLAPPTAAPVKAAAPSPGGGAAGAEGSGLGGSGPDATEAGGTGPSDTSGTATAGIEAEAAVPAQEMSTRQAAAAAAAADPPRPRQAAGLAGLASIIRAVGYAGILSLTGGLVFVAFLWPQGAGLARTRRLLGAALVTTLGATLVSMGALGASLRGRSLLSAFNPATGADTLGTSVGDVLSARAGLVAAFGCVLAAMLSRPERTLRLGWRVAVVGLGLGALATYGLTGHPRSEGTAAALTSVVHLAAGAVWLGGLVMLALAVLPRRDPSLAGPLVRRFSTVAFVSVAVMAASGSALVLLVGPRLGHLVGTGYGTALLVKLALVALVIAAADRSRRFTRRYLAASGAHCELGPLVLTVAIEVGLAFGVLSATAALVSRSPGA